MTARAFLSLLIVLMVRVGIAQEHNARQPTTRPAANLAIAAAVSTSFVSGHETLTAVQDGVTPTSSRDYSRGAYGNWPQHGTQWVQYVWARPVRVDGVSVYWWDDRRGVRLPTAARVLYWNGADWTPVRADNEAAIGVKPDTANRLSFAAVSTDKLRLEMTASADASTGVLEWAVQDAGGSPAFPPVVDAGPDRVTQLGGKTYLSAAARSATSTPPTVVWSKATGPGDVTFANPAALMTTATFEKPGDYVLRFAARVGDEASAADVHVRVTDEPPAAGLSEVVTRKYSLTSPLWTSRTKALIVNWIPHCVAEIDKPDLKEGGMANIIEAGNKLAGRPFKPHVGYPFSNAWVLNTVEAMCVAQALDGGGGGEIEAAQAAFRKKLDEWIPMLLAAQEPDGYFQTRITLGTPNENRNGTAADSATRRWQSRLRGEHEGYVAGYFIEAGIANHTATNGRDTRLYDAAKKLADCWAAHIGPNPGQQAWYDGHEEMEQACFRLAAYVDTVDGPGRGKKYADLARFLLDCRGRGQQTAAAGGDFFTGAGGGSEYDQTHLPVTRQYRAVGHAVRAVYLYSAMAAAARQGGDTDCLSATGSLWHNLAERNVYLTGGVGSGETSEGFGHDYSLPNNAYCESCAGAGMLFFQHQMNLLHGDAQYADAYEDVLYNALLSDIDLDGQNFTYTNALDTAERRYPWHVCPCCVGNIPRVLLALPTWTYVRTPDGAAVNLFIGGRTTVPDVAGGDVTFTQTTDYPWDGRVTISVDPAAGPREFALRVRVPRRDVISLYTPTPAVEGLNDLKVNDRSIAPTTERGYAVIRRTWSPGDRVSFTVPLVVQRVKANDAVAADRGRVALRYGPLVYNFEAIDQPIGGPLGGDPIRAEWTPGLLGGVVTLNGHFADGTAFRAVPNYARNNRGGRSVVWVKE